MKRAASMLAVVAVGVLAAGCAQSSMARFENATVLYDGPAYGDMLFLLQRVRECMHSDKQALPRVVLLDRIFDCYTTDGWQQAYGCTGQDEVIMVAHVAEASQGQLWSHELTHYFGTQAEDDPCGTLALPGFSLQRLPDAGL